MNLEADYTGIWNSRMGGDSTGCTGLHGDQTPCGTTASAATPNEGSSVDEAEIGLKGNTRLPHEKASPKEVVNTGKVCPVGKYGE